MPREYHEFGVDAPSVSTAVIEAVARQSGIAEAELPPLFDVVDPDALNQLFQPMADGFPRRGGRIEFPYAGYHVTISMNRSMDISVSSTPD